MVLEEWLRAYVLTHRQQAEGATLGLAWAVENSKLTPRGIPSPARTYLLILPNIYKLRTRHTDIIWACVGCSHSNQHRWASQISRNKIWNVTFPKWKCVFLSLFFFSLKKQSLEQSLNSNFPLGNITQGPA